ncbi:hypothetical protein SPBR_05141 [Sporothrix brasiliensis 5110]|uniref:Enoyl reductase (ER) domain-containing protein n=1 Tax=Sporothrix brasiliensis 5110 TaxID=1398154 RepID=A0A0C2FA58_9PEZI|nr:uncharacterized protein SPBR_05141 [Sporothrix brasiliensis 5110]KIH87973.1 hypothetical protein SPBR_05141 [Sporothrix brasiliensis 5110]
MYPKMRAWVRTKRGMPPTSLKLRTDVPTPANPTGSISSDVIIRVSHVALQFNSKLFLNLLPSVPFWGSRTWIPELEFSGEVVAAGSGAPPEVRDVGTRVVAFQTISGLALGYGVLAEYVRIPGTQVVPLPESVDFVQASGVTGAGCTALKLLRKSGVKRGQRVLVNGASGSVGSVLIQLCKSRGIYVVGIASGANEATVRGWGADEFVDYRAHVGSLPEFLTETYRDTPFDFIMDCVGKQDLFVGSPGYLRAEGATLNIGALEGVFRVTGNLLSNMLRPVWLGGVPRRYIFFSSPPLHGDVVILAQLMGEGKLTTPVDSVFVMEELLAAYDRVATKRACGKVVIKVGAK